MEKTTNAEAWLEVGYNLFAEEGVSGIQIERLARILQLNKSGFYHYFGDLEGYYLELVEHHHQKVHYFIHDVNMASKLDPDYLALLICHSSTVMFQVQLTRNKQNPFYEASEIVDIKVNQAVKRLWSDFLGVDISTDVGMRYYYLVRDKFYTRISFLNLNYEYLHNLVTEAKVVVSQLRQGEPSVMSKVAR
jgi:AcrR family transcriptional regulator